VVSGITLKPLWGIPGISNDPLGTCPTHAALPQESGVPRWRRPLEPWPKCHIVREFDPHEARVREIQGFTRWMPRRS
jgi:hypothetical protein